MPNVLSKQRPQTGAKEDKPDSSTKQRLIDTAKMILEVAKESADFCPPLKSCLGGITALMKLCEESKDAEEKLKDLIPWLIKLKETVPPPGADANSEDAKRDEQLKLALEDIGNQSNALLQKSAEARFFDHKQDSAKVSKLVERLRQSILIYQFSQQQAMYNQVKKLASSLEVFSKLHENEPGVKVKIESALLRLGALVGALGIEGGTSGDESKRRELFEALGGIKYKLQPIFEQCSAAGYQENPEDIYAVCELIEDVKGAVLEYQLAHQDAMYKQNLRLIESVEWDVLNKCDRAKGAGYKHGNRHGCLKGTRESVLNEIGYWARDFERPPIYWLNGLAGTGKSTIAQTMAEQIFADGHLGASFFCSRDFTDRSNIQLIFPTLAYQLAQSYPGFRSSLISILQSNPDITHEPLQAQVQSLIVEPLLSVEISTVIVIDALDECKGEHTQSDIICAIRESLSGVPQTKIKFFITSRPEKDIISGFSDPVLQGLTKTFVLHMVDPHTVDNDIRLFFEYELSKLAPRCGGIQNWPTGEQLSSLCQRAAGFFVYAVATVKFLNHKFRRPSEQLNVIMKSPEITAHEGKAKLEQYASLDSLYLSILREAFNECSSAEDCMMVHSVLKTIVLAFNPLSPSAISTLLGFECDVVISILKPIQSLLVLDEDTKKPIKLFHKSFPDFITDPTRCTDPQFCVLSDCHNDLALSCIKLLNEHCDSSEVLEYASSFWSGHLVAVTYLAPNTLSPLCHLLEHGLCSDLRVSHGVKFFAISNIAIWLGEIHTDS